MDCEKDIRIKQLECELGYLINDSMDTESKIKKLSEALWSVNNSGYCDAMANKLMSGIDDCETRLWDKNCSNKYIINELYDLLNAE